MLSEYVFKFDLVAMDSASASVDAHAPEKVSPQECQNGPELTTDDAWNRLIAWPRQVRREKHRALRLIQK